MCVCTLASLCCVSLCIHIMHMSKAKRQQNAYCTFVLLHKKQCEKREERGVNRVRGRKRGRESVDDCDLILCRLRALLYGRHQSCLTEGAVDQRAREATERRGMLSL